MSELLKPITRHDICSAINAASNERFVPYAVHADLKAKYEKVNDILLRLKNSLLTAEFNKELRDYYLNKMSELGEK